MSFEAYQYCSSVPASWDGKGLQNGLWPLGVTVEGEGRWVLAQCPRGLEWTVKL